MVGAATPAPEDLRALLRAHLRHLAVDALADQLGRQLSGGEHPPTQLVQTGEAFRGLASERARRLTAYTLLLAADFALKRAVHRGL